MNRIEWDACLSVDGGGRVDREHQTLVGILNRLSDPAERRQRTHLTGVITELRSYTHEHFAHEQEMMRRIGWPEADRHALLHNAFITTVDRWSDRVARRWQPWHGGSVFVVCASWLLTHIMDEDSRVGVYARTGRVPPRVHRKPIHEILNGRKECLSVRMRAAASTRLPLAAARANEGKP